LFRPLGVAKWAVRYPTFKVFVVLAIVIKTMMRAKKVRLVFLGPFLSTGRHFFFLAVVGKWKDFFFAREGKKK
jgi:hypothetical protein